MAQDVLRIQIKYGPIVGQMELKVFLASLQLEVARLSKDPLQ